MQGDFKFNSGHCNCLMMILDASNCCSLCQAFSAEQSCLRLFFFGLQGENEDLVTDSYYYRTDNVTVNPLFLNAPAYCKRSQSTSNRNSSSIDFLSFILIFKTAKDIENA